MLLVSWILSDGQRLLYTGSIKWIPGMILRKLGPVTFDVETTYGQIVKWYINLEKTVPILLK